MTGYLVKWAADDECTFYENLEQLEEFLDTLDLYQIDDDIEVFCLAGITPLEISVHIDKRRYSYNG